MSLVLIINIKSIRYESTIINIDIECDDDSVATEYRMFNPIFIIIETKHPILYQPTITTDSIELQYGNLFL